MEYNAAVLGAAVMPERIWRLPISPRGWPTPWFVAWFDGVPDFRVVDTPKFKIAVDRHRCWICGEQLGRNLAFVIGPMCAITRTISEPPSHRECAVFSAQACPFLANPRMRRRPELPDCIVEAPGEHLDRNPGAAGVWVTRSYQPFRAHHGNDGTLFTFDDPVEVLWFANGRPAERHEVKASINSGLPALYAAAARDPKPIEARKELLLQISRAERYLPAPGAHADPG